LIQGKAGSGKSTAARKIEEFLWLLYQKNKDIQGAIPIIPIFVPLP
jgi:DNA helicase IV